MSWKSVWLAERYFKIGCRLSTGLPSEYQQAKFAFQRAMWLNYHLKVQIDEWNLNLFKRCIIDSGAIVAR
jgi:hypothetical protein